MIFPRSPRRGNALAVLAALWLGGCTGWSGYRPADVVLEDAHLKGQVLAFDPPAATLASAGSDGEIRLWRLPRGEPLARFRAHAGSIYGLQFVADGDALVSAGYDGRLALWSRDGRLLRERQTPAAITDMAGDERADRLVTGHADGAVRLWRLSDFAPRGEQPLHRGAVLAVAVHGSGLLASSGEDGQVYVWQDNQAPRPLPAPPTDAADLAFSPDGRWLVGSGWFRLFRWELGGGGALRVLPTAHHGLIRSIAYAADGRTLASISRHTDSAVYFHDPQTGAVTQRFVPHDLCGGFVLLSPDGRYLATTSDDASVRIWKLK